MDSVRVPSLVIFLHHFHMPYSWILSAFSFEILLVIIYTFFKGYFPFIVITKLATIFFVLYGESLSPSYTQ